MAIAIQITVTFRVDLKNGVWERRSEFGTVVDCLPDLDFLNLEGTTTTRAERGDADWRLHFAGRERSREGRVGNSRSQGDLPVAVWAQGL